MDMPVEELESYPFDEDMDSSYDEDFSGRNLKVEDKEESSDPKMVEDPDQNRHRKLGHYTRRCYYDYWGNVRCYWVYHSGRSRGGWGGWGGKSGKG